MLRRRVPGQDVEDLAQTILCDALAANAMPADEEELRRWLIGIARHKIADFHRRAYRVTARTVGDEPLATCTTSPAAFEEREVLQRMLGEVRSRRDAETMEWLVREHGGERLTDIAEENSLGADVVRQRVSRLRRALRAAAAGLVILVAGAAAYALTHERVAIQPERISVEAPAVVRKPPILVELQGDWVVQGLRPDHELTANEQKLADSYSKSAKLHIEGDQATIRAGAFTETWRVTDGDGEHELRIGPDRVTVTIRRDRSGPHVDLRLAGHPRLSGIATLRRPIF